MAPIIGLKQHPNPYEFSWKDLGEEVVKKGARLLGEYDLAGDIKKALQTAKDKGLIAGSVAMGAVAIGTVGVGARAGGSVGGGPGAAAGFVVSAALVAAGITLFASNDPSDDAGKTADRILNSPGRSSSPSPSSPPPSSGGPGGIPDLSKVPMIIGAATIIDSTIDHFSTTPKHITETPEMNPGINPAHHVEAPSHNTNTPNQFTSTPSMTQPNGTSSSSSTDHPDISPRVDQSTPTPDETGITEPSTAESIRSTDVHGEYINESGTGIHQTGSNATTNSAKDNSDYINNPDLNWDDTEPDGWWENEYQDTDSKPNDAPKEKKEPDPKTLKNSANDDGPGALPENLDDDDGEIDFGGLEDLIESLGGRIGLGNNPSIFDDPDLDDPDELPARTRKTNSGQRYDAEEVSDDLPQEAPEPKTIREVEDARIKIDQLQARRDQLHRIWRPDKPQMGRGIRGNESEYQAACDRIKAIDQEIEELLQSITTD
jgi:hypothetical protein